MKTKVFSLAVALLLGTSAIYAQDGATEAAKDTTWKTGGLLGINLSNVQLTNWAAGGFSSISGNANINLFANMKKGKDSWDNNLILGYGLLKQGDNGDTQKTDDRIDFTSKYGREAWSPSWSYSALANFRTQFTEGLGDAIINVDGTTTDNVISDFLAPAYALASLGLDYKPNDNFSMFISPLTAKFTFVGDQDLADAGAFGVEAAFTDETGKFIEGENSRSEFGAYLNASYNKELMENVSLLTRLDLFTNYETFEYVDVNWDAVINLKVNDYITTSFGATAIYDHDIKITDSDGKVGPRTQLRTMLGVGFAYAL